MTTASCKHDDRLASRLWSAQESRRGASEDLQRATQIEEWAYRKPPHVRRALLEAAELLRHDAQHRLGHALATIAEVTEVRRLRGVLAGSVWTGGADEATVAETP